MPVPGEQEPKFSEFKMNLNSGCSKFAWKFSDSKGSSLRKKKKFKKKITEFLPFLPHSAALPGHGAAMAKIPSAGGWSRSVPALCQPQGPAAQWNTLRGSGGFVPAPCTADGADNAGETTTIPLVKIFLFLVEFPNPSVRNLLPADCRGFY